jgi:lipopolysaccharide transport system ATP-binding protein
VLLIDEVLAVGDVEFQKKCLGKMGTVASGGRTILFVSHNMAAVRNLCKRAILLDEGQIVRDGDSGEVIEDYIRLSDRSSGGAHPGVFDLSARRNPCRDGPPLVRSMALLDADGVPSASFQMGSPMRVALEIDALNRYPASQVGITVKSVYGQWLCSSNTGMACTYESATRGDSERAELSMAAVRLTPGRYTIEVQVSQKGSALIDRVEDAGSFDVVDADVYGTGYQVSSYYGVFYVDGTWTVSNRD